MTVENPHAGQGPVLLDIGGEVGALVVTMPAALDGVEVEIRPVGGSSSLGHAHDHAHDHHHHDDDGSHGHTHDHEHPHLIHVAVVSRPVGGMVVPSLVYPELVEGAYELYQRPAGPVELTVTVVGGEVTEARWPEGSLPQ
ncbi:MAG TPA: hypothetical protein VIT20_01635 [Propionibacteriaceae bacterium]